MQQSGEMAPTVIQHEASVCPGVECQLKNFVQIQAGRTILANTIYSNESERDVSGNPHLVRNEFDPLVNCKLGLGKCLHPGYCKNDVQTCAQP